MNDNAIKNYAVWARRELIDEVAKRCALYGIEAGADANLDFVGGRVLSSQERVQRRDLLQLLKSESFEQLVEKAAYTWFNRLLAIRFMEVNDRLPGHVRVLSAPDGSFKPQVLTEAMDLSLEALDTEKAVELVQSGDDESLFRLIFLAQCDELAGCMPAVFDRVGSAMELLLPDGLLRQGGVVERLVTSIPESDWTEGVEIVGWMYQYYVSERKDEVFASFKKGKKAERDAIAPATQLFTPNWIVRYLTENSLGRLWMLNKPDSSLVDKMPYFVKPDEDAETEFKRISSPEDITVVDPACGSGHILVYAFDLLAQMYAEAGYSSRDAARLIIEKNLSGMEIDPRAGAMASFALTMKACEVDSRFLRRGVSPRITVLSRIEFESEEMSLLPGLRKRREFVDAVAHLDECGSLLSVSAADLSAIEGDLASLAGNGSLFADSARAKLELMASHLEPLSRRYDIVVANPPYMGSSSLGKWMGSWARETYPESYRDLCTSFIDRGFSLSSHDGYSAMVTMQSWMFLGSFEKLRGTILRNHSISSMAHLGTRAFGAIAGEVVSTTATVFSNMKSAIRGTYFRLVDMGSETEKQAGLLEALANPECSWFYRAMADNFAKIPGSPIAYWASEKMLEHFRRDAPMSAFTEPRQGFATGDNNRFLREWWEPSFAKSYLSTKSSGLKKWYPCNKGGGFRKWYGNNEFVVNWENDGAEMKSFAGSVIRNSQYYFKKGMTWGTISSGKLSMRFSPEGFLFESKGSVCFPLDENDLYLHLALVNACVATPFLEILCPTLDFHEGPVGKIPTILPSIDNRRVVECLVEKCISSSKEDWDAFESSWDFKRHPLL